MFAGGALLRLGPFRQRLRPSKPRPPFFGTFTCVCTFFSTCAACLPTFCTFAATFFRHLLSNLGMVVATSHFGEFFFDASSRSCFSSLLPPLLLSRLVRLRVLCRGGSVFLLHSSLTRALASCVFCWAPCGPGRRCCLFAVDTPGRLCSSCDVCGWLRPRVQLRTLRSGCSFSVKLADVIPKNKQGLQFRAVLQVRIGGPTGVQLLMRSHSGNVMLELAALVGVLGFCDACPDLSKFVSCPMKMPSLKPDSDCG